MITTQDEWRLLIKRRKAEYKSDRSFSKLFEYLGDTDFFTAPASTRFHSCVEGGLSYHSFKVAIILEDLTLKNELVWEDPLSPLVIGLCHDICKINCYQKEWKSQKKKNPDGSFVMGLHGKPVWEDVVSYTFDDSSCPMGHGAKSAIVSQRYIPLTEQEQLCILWHMGGVSNTDGTTGNSYFTASNKEVNVLWTNVADRIACIQEEREAQQRLIDELDKDFEVIP
jgi:hypothetical protein